MATRGDPGPQGQADEKEKQQTVEMILGPQLGAHPEIMADGRWDPRIVTNVNEIDVFCITYLRALPSHRGGNKAREMIDDFIHFKMSVHGWRANQMIRMVAGSKGAPAFEKVREPGFMARNVTNRGWRRKAEREGRETEA